MNKPLECVVSVSGFRGVVGDTIDPGTVMHLAAAYGRSIARGGRVILGRDSRPTGALFSQAVAVGLRGVGCDVVDIGVVPTPTVPIAVKAQRAKGGIQVSASHNPVEWNALKCFDKRGRNIDQGQLDRLLAAYAKEAGPAWQRWDGLGQASVDESALDRHLDLVLKAVDVDLIRARGFTVLLDSVNGAGANLGPRLLRELGCRVVPLYDDPDSVFPRNPEPTAANVRETGAVVKAVGADVGFVQDPDADRLACIDGRGRYLGEEYTLVLCAAARLAAARAAGQRKPIAVTNLSTSRMLEDVAAACGGRVVRTAVGEANVVDGMQAHDAVIGGEGNGGVIEPRVVWGRDSHIAMALVLEHLARTETDLAGAVAAMPSYAMHKEKLPVDRAAVSAAIPVILDNPPEPGATADHTDGLKLIWKDAWVHVRASGTEPASRIIAEAPTAKRAKALAAAVRRHLRS